MKRGITASIVVLVSSIATLILNGVLAFIFMIAFDLAVSLSGGTADTGNVGLLIAVLVVLMILSVINIVMSISSLINFKRLRDNLGRLKALLIWFVVSLIVTIICNIVFIVLTFGSVGVWLSIVATLIYVVCIVLIMLEIKAIITSLHSSNNMSQSV